MSQHFFVCPNEENILSRLNEKSVVIKLSRYDQLKSALQFPKKYNFHLHCLLIQSHLPLAYFDVQEGLINIPIALYSRELGDFAIFINKLPLLRKLNIRIYFPVSNESNFSSIRILSSLGIETALLFDRPDINWEKLNDLMVYALLNLTPHAPIAPFNYIASRYENHQLTRWGAVYFDDPSTYLHIDLSGKIALSVKDFNEGNFAVDRIEQVDEFVKSKEYQDYLDSWRNEFLKEDGCAYCAAWRICVGRLSSRSMNRHGCSSVFTELLDSIEQYKSVHEYRNQTLQIWQP